VSDHSTRVVVVGAGPNGLTMAFYLAKAGLQPLVLEARDTVGGGAITAEIATGFKGPVLAHAIGPLRASVVRDMGLERRVQFVRPDPRLAALSPDGRALVFSTDVARTAESIGAFSAKDAARYPEFCATLARLGAFLSPILESTPPSLGSPAAGEVWDLLKTGKRFRSLGRDDAFRLLRWGPMAAADLVAEWFESDLLEAVVASRGVFGVAQGPWSAGTGAVLLLNAAMDPAPGGSSVTVMGGPGALTRAMAEAAREAGAEIRTSAAVKQILTRDGRVTGVLLADGSEIPARAVVSRGDSRSTFLALVDPMDLEPGFLTKVRNYRAPGVVAKVNLALSALPSFRGVANPADLHGRIHIGPSIDYLERAFDASKYGRVSEEPWLDIAIPTLNEPSLALGGRHVMSVYVQYAPYSLRRAGLFAPPERRAGLYAPPTDAAGSRAGLHAPPQWDDAREDLAATVLRTLEGYAPGIGALVEHQQVITPLDLERTYGYAGGHILHGEPSLDQLYAMRPILGWAQYRTPIEGLFLCGAGTHPGGGITGGSGQNAAREIVKKLKA
jgi:phytoene dehydrogenase-like protein